MQTSRKPIGIYDSGVGGLTVWLALRSLIKEDIIYFGDTANIPYGDKSREEIMFFSRNIIDYFRERGVKAVVAACNTSSALAVPALRLTAGMPLFGMIEPAVKQAVAMTENHRIGLIATAGTVASGSYQRMFASVSPRTRVFAQGCPKLVPLIEAGYLSGEAVDQALRECLTPLLEEGIDTLVLGCTHYPFLQPAIRKIVGPTIKIVDPAKQTAQDVLDWLRASGNLDSVQGNPKYEFVVSGNPEEFQRRAEQFINMKIDRVSRHIPPVERELDQKVYIGDVSPAWRGDQDE